MSNQRVKDAPKKTALSDKFHNTIEITANNEWPIAPFAIHSKRTLLEEHTLNFFFA